MKIEKELNCLMFTDFIDDDGEENHQSTIGLTVGGQTVGVM